MTSLGHPVGRSGGRGLSVVRGGRGLSSPSTPPPLAEDPVFTPHECFRRISRRLRSVLKRSRIPMVSARLPPSPAFPPLQSVLVKT